MPKSVERTSDERTTPSSVPPTNNELPSACRRRACCFGAEEVAVHRGSDDAAPALLQQLEVHVSIRRRSSCAAALRLHRALRFHRALRSQRALRLLRVLRLCSGCSAPCACSAIASPACGALRAPLLCDCIVDERRQERRRRGQCVLRTVPLYRYPVQSMIFQKRACIFPHSVSK